jgi:hypothetical protein
LVRRKKAGALAEALLIQRGCQLMAMLWIALDWVRW